MLITPNLKRLEKVLNQDIYLLPNRQKIDGIIKLVNADKREIISEHNLKRADMIEYNTDIYYITSQPNHRFNSYYRATIEKTDIKFRVKYHGGEIREYHAMTSENFFTINNDLGSFTTDDSKIRIVVKDTKQDMRDIRFFVNELLYKVDTVSYTIKDFVVLYCKRDLINEEKDDKANRLAYNEIKLSNDVIVPDEPIEPPIEPVVPDEPEPEPSNQSISVDGYFKIRQNQTLTYEVTIVGDVKDYIIKIIKDDGTDITEQVQITEKTDTSFKLKNVDLAGVKAKLIVTLTGTDISSGLDIELVGRWG